MPLAISLQKLFPAAHSPFAINFHGFLANQRSAEIEPFSNSCVGFATQ